jgi:hypothetical protein
MSQPEKVACKFIKQPSLEKCRKITSFEGMPNGCTIPSEIGLLTALTELSLYEVGSCISGKAGNFFIIGSIMCR